MSLHNWPHDEQMMVEATSDCLCHRLLTLLSPTYRILEALGDTRALEMRKDIRKRIEDSEWRGRVRAQAIQEAILNHRQEGNGSQAGLARLTARWSHEHVSA